MKSIKEIAKSKKTMFLIGLLITAVMVLLADKDLLVTFERKSVDLRTSAVLRAPSENIVIVGITDEDLKAFGQWPWPREVHARVIDALAAAGPKVIGYDVLISDPGKDPGYDKQMVVSTAKARNVVYPVYVQKLWDKSGVVYGNEFIIPLPQIAAAATGLGHNVMVKDPDGVVRRVALALSTEQGTLDAFSLTLYKLYAGLDVEALPLDQALDLHDVRIPLDDKGLMTIAYAGPTGTFQVIPVSSLLDGKVQAGELKDKIVLVGGTTPGLKTLFDSPFGKMPISEVEIHANVLDTIISGNYFQETSKTTSLLALGILGLAMTFVFPLLSPVRGFIAGVAVVLSYSALAFYLGTRSHLLIQMVYPVVALLVLYISTVIYGFIQERLEKQKITSTFGRYVAPQVVEEILKNSGDFAGVKSRRQLVTVLFVDLNGFTPLSEKLPPEDLVNVLNRYLKLVVEIIFKYEGTIDKFIGDAVMVIFNAPMPVENHEYKAACAALEIKKEMVALSAEVEREYGIKLSASIGINTGEVIIGNIGALNRMEYAAIGDNVNTSARLQSLAGHGQILMSASAYQSVGDSILVTPMGQKKVKGKEQTIEVYQVDGLKV